MSRGIFNFDESAIEYYTPKYFVDIFGKFDYDPATAAEQANRLGIPNYDTAKTDGLKSDWTKYKHIWINPPFNLKHQFWEKACETYAKCKNEICFLCPISFLTTKRFNNPMNERKLNVHIAIPDWRIKFINRDGQVEKSPAFGSVVVIPTEDTEGKIWRIKERKNK